MTFLTTDALAGLAGLNAVALLMLLVSGRKRSGGAAKKARERKSARRRKREANAETKPPVLKPEDPLHDLVLEIEQREAAIRSRPTGEERLAESLARWRERMRGGDSLPPAAASCRSGPERLPKRVA